MTEQWTPPEPVEYDKDEPELAEAKEESLALLVGHRKWLDWLKDKGFNE